ncbi:hypothetical protein L6R50_07680 [Myxococcota bacterium]|nr:hypothetical protein [Myxococcota bacterium]
MRRPPSSVVLAALLAAAPAAAAAPTAWVASNQIRVVDLQRGEVVGQIPLQEFVHDIEFSTAGDRAFVASAGGLRVADAEGLAFTATLSDRPTVAVAVDEAHGAVLAILSPPGEEALAARRAGTAEPPCEVAVFDAASGERRASWPVAGLPRDIAVDGARGRIYVLEIQSGRVIAFDGTGRELDSIDLTQKAERYMFTRMRLSEDGSTLVAPRTDADRTVLVEVHPLAARDATDRVRFQDLGHARRVGDLAFGRDGQVYLSSLFTVARVPPRGAAPTFERFDLAYSGIEVVPDSGEIVLIAPTLDPQIGSGGVTLADADGKVIRSVELVDISPFTVAVRPSPPTR